MFLIEGKNMYICKRICIARSFLGNRVQIQPGDRIYKIKQIRANIPTFEIGVVGRGTLYITKEKLLSNFRES